jgi:hypothetical protein
MEDSQLSFRAPKRPQSQILCHGELFRSRVPAGSARGEGSRSYRTAGVSHPGRIVPHPPRDKRRVATRPEAARRQTGWLPPLSRISCTLLVAARGGSGPETALPDSRNQKRSCRKPHLPAHLICGHTSAGWNASGAKKGDPTQHHENRNAKIDGRVRSADHSTRRRHRAVPDPFRGHTWPRPASRDRHCS